MTLEEIMEVVEEEDFDVTLTGGDPLHDPEALKALVKALKINGRNIWIYTGFTWEEIAGNETLLSAVKEADVIVDGLYVESLRDPDLPFRGSSNQRIIDVHEQLAKK